jgi:hypothetical protein
MGGGIAPEAEKGTLFCYPTILACYLSHSFLPFLRLTQAILVPFAALKEN